VIDIEAFSCSNNTRTDYPIKNEGTIRQTLLLNNKQTDKTIQIQLIFWLHLNKQSIFYPCWSIQFAHKITSVCFSTWF